MKKYLSIVLACLMMFTLLACGSESGDDTDNNSSTTQGATTSVTTDDVAYLNASGESVYTIVRPENSELDEGARASYLFKQMKNVLGVNVKNGSDQDDGTDAYEILVGPTNRPESSAAMNYMFEKDAGRHEDFIICTMGKKIVINAHNAESLDAACQYFVENYLSADGVKGGIAYIKTTEGDFKDITVNGVNIGKFVIVRPHYNSSYLTQVEIEALVESVYSLSGYMLKIKEDTYTAESEYEIIVGNTNRSGVEKLSDSDLYNVTVSGSKVYLNGGNTYSTAIAVTAFKNLIADGSIVDAESVKSGSYSASFTEYCDATVTYRPVWYDDFEGNTIDTTKWDVIDEEYAKRDETTGTSGQHGLRAWRKPENVTVENGCFVSTATRDEQGYYSGTIRSNDHMSFKYGYVEGSMIIPQGSGFWSTIWMSTSGVLQTKSYVWPEIDIAESFGNSAVADANAHVWPTEYHRSFDNIRPNESKYNVQKTDGKLLNDDFHTFGFLWTEDYIAFTADGKIYCDLNINEPGFEDYKEAYTTARVKLIVAGTAGFCNCPLPQTATDEEWENSNKYIVDYVHLYQLLGSGSELYIDNQPVNY